MLLEEVKGIKPKGKELLKYFVAIAPYINKITVADMGIAVVEDDTYLIYVPNEKLNFKIKPGDKVPEGTVARRCMKEKRIMVDEFTRETSPFGIPYIAKAWPVLDNAEKAVGCIVTVETTESMEFIRNTAENLGSSSQQLAASMQDLSGQAEKLANIAQKFKELTQSTVGQVKETDNIISFIRKVANQTNLLGLNAAIEAARVGDLGKGFGVVADEVRKLALDSSKSVEQITEVLNAIKKAIINVEKQSSDVDKYVSQQLNVIEELTSSSQELSAMAQELQAFTKL